MYEIPSAMHRREHILADNQYHDDQCTQSIIVKIKGSNATQVLRICFCDDYNGEGRGLNTCISGSMAPGDFAFTDTSLTSSTSMVESFWSSGSEKSGLSYNGIQMPRCHPPQAVPACSARAPWCSHQGLHPGRAPDSGCRPAQAPAEASVS